MIRKILLVLLLALIAIQFFHPKRNKTTADQQYAIGKKFPIPADVNHILSIACLDCHSNNTRYPWYSKVQPVDWWMTGHINKAKRELNFDEYTNKSPRYQYNKMKASINELKEGAMPLKSYLWIHKDAKLTKEEKDKVMAWANSVMDTLKAHYPMDSLVRKK